MTNAYGEMKSILNRIYGEAAGEAAYDRIVPMIEAAGALEGAGGERYSQSDAVLITYGDTITGEEGTALKALHEFAHRYLTDCFSAIHLLPFYPFSSDDGFSVIDYIEVNPSVGVWSDVERMSQDFDLMFDYVLNHVSAQSQWFKNYLNQEEGYCDLAIDIDPDVNLSLVTRPRALPLLTPVIKANGDKAYVWTTFSDDQIDLNFKSLDVLTRMLAVLLFYVRKGARLIRMDAVAYLWKEIGTTCIHLSQTHDMVRLFRKVLDLVAPEVVIITETNVPHAENISYFGNGQDEAQMVYNFTLPPLLLHTFNTGDAGKLTAWAKSLATPSQQTTFFNFTASHDGIGVRPVEGILSGQEIDQLVGLAKANGGQVSYKHNPDGSKSPYELNLTYVDAMGGDAEKFLASQAIALVLPGVPGIYIHSLVGSRNWKAGVDMTGRARTINRSQVPLADLEKELTDKESFRARIFFPYCHMLKVRRTHPAFHPNAGFQVLDLADRVMAVMRSLDEQHLYTLTNVAADTVTVSLATYGAPAQMRDLLTDRTYLSDALQLKPFQTLWLEG